mmetsp:Transcript_25270/g.38315  ORF Transcript_25270/g.38315 Transcript_25270/m.38315 type:complete len:517 (-) Transcript_25270:733-2283(-)
MCLFLLVVIALFAVELYAFGLHSHTTIITFKGRNGRTQIDLGNAIGQKSRKLRDHHHCLPLYLFPFDRKLSDPSSSINETGTKSDQDYDESSRRRRIRKKMSRLATKIIAKPISNLPMPGAIASILKDATLETIDMAVDKVMADEPSTQIMSAKQADDISDLIEEAFAPMEAALQEMEDSLATARCSLQDAKDQAKQAIEVVQAAALQQAETTVSAVVAAEEAATEKVLSDIFDDGDIDVESLAYDDVGYHLSEMSPPFIDEAQCLVPGEAVVRVEKAPDNSRRIFAGVDIPVGVEAVWDVLTDYANLQKVVPNLAVNEVLSEFDGIPFDQAVIDESLPDEKQCKDISKQLKGALLKQVGKAKVAGINFSARTTLEVREWPMGLPDFAHFRDDFYEGKDRDTRAIDDSNVPLTRYRFPRPFALSSLPSKDISMQSVENDDGEFRMYQGVWRMQPLPGCAPEGEEAMRLTYAVEVSPRRYLPVSVIEGRIVKDMCTNLVAIRDYLTTRSEPNSSPST